MPRFVLLEHDHPYPHFDLMLEAGPVLWTWRLAALPSENPVEATRVADHRLVYLTYEGPISGGRGSVRRQEEGEFTWQSCEEGMVVVNLSGRSLRGTVSLRQQKADRWQLSYRPETEP
jgi:hypothetical protein